MPSTRGTWSWCPTSTAWRSIRSTSGGVSRRRSTDSPSSNPRSETSGGFELLSLRTESALDGVGRILLPPDSRKDAGLEKDVTLVGGGLPMFEVWDRARFEEYERTRSDALPSLFQSLAADGV